MDDVEDGDDAAAGAPPEVDAPAAAACAPPEVPPACPCWFPPPFVEPLVLPLVVDAVGCELSLSSRKAYFLFGPCFCM